jgi:hypothetical protein
MTTNDKETDSSIPGGTGGTAIPKTDITASAKVMARKKNQQQQQKNQKANPLAAKNKPTQVDKSNFKGNASSTSHMEGVVIAQSIGNLAGQFRVFQKKLAGAAAADKVYGLDSAITYLEAKSRSDFVQPKPSPLVHSNLVSIMEADNVTPMGGKKLVCHDPILKEQMDAGYSMDLKLQKANWNQYERFYDGYYSIAVGNVEDTILTYCRADVRVPSIERSKDLIGFLLVLRLVCTKK